ncbi:AraC family transcriptional regulator [Parapedobacter soli]|uniref:AraC family transcriptional regulator n=1 Tax=Parapedobacter soli TaxID=416955 RepID=UPI0021C7C616|nr:AraC family transcriptional regulator [Parapedobacter soli]
MDNYHKYLHISKIDKEWGFYVNTVGYCRTPKNIHYPSATEHPADHVFSWNKGRILDGYYVVFISSGSGVFESAETTPQIIEAGTCFLLYPGVWHRYKPNRNIGWEEYWVGFQGSYPAQIMEQFFTPKNPIVKTGLNKDLLVAFTNLLAAVSQAEMGYSQIVSGITLSILGLLNRINLTSSPKDDSESVWVSQAAFILQNRLSENINIEALVQKFPISYSKFRKSFKRLMGKSPNQYHLDLRLDKASELLGNTHLTIKEIGYHTGFESPYYFSRVFSAKFGMSPKAFRKNAI